jgi:hypothetical protein
VLKVCDKPCATSPVLFLWLLRPTFTKPEREIGDTTAVYRKTNILYIPPQSYHVNKKYISAIINLRLEISFFMYHR